VHAESLELNGFQSAESVKSVFGTFGNLDIDGVALLQNMRNGNEFSILAADLQSISGAFAALVLQMDSLGSFSVQRFRQPLRRMRPLRPAGLRPLCAAIDAVPPDLAD
jgi:hypothetical protein